MKKRIVFILLVIASIAGHTQTESLLKSSNCPISSDKWGVVAYLQSIKSQAEAKLLEYQSLCKIKNIKNDTPPFEFIRLKAISDQFISSMISDVASTGKPKSFKMLDKNWRIGNYSAKNRDYRSLKSELDNAYRAWLDFNKLDDLTDYAKKSGKQDSTMALDVGIGDFDSAGFATIPWTIYKESRELAQSKADNIVSMLEGCRIGAAAKSKEEE